MNYEKFNDTMCKLRQAEEEFNKKLEEVFKPICDEILRIDEEYVSQQDFCIGDEVICINGNQKNFNKKHIYLGKNGWHIALCRLEDGEMHFISNLTNYRKTGKHYNINLYIDKVSQWKAEKDKEEQELHVGDEVIADYGIVGIITDVGDGNGIVWVTYRLTPAARGFDFCWANSAKCKKTGRHFDSIPFDYNTEKEEETNK